MNLVVLIINYVVVLDVKGDPGVSQFYLSLEDELMKRFGSERVSAFLDRMRISGEDAVIKSGLITRQIESSQKTCRRK